MNVKLYLGRYVKRRYASEICSQVPNDVANIVETAKGCFVPCEDDPRYKPQDEDILKHPAMKRNNFPPKAV